MQPSHKSNLHCMNIFSFISAILGLASFAAADRAHAPLIQPRDPELVIPGQYIVVLDEKRHNSNVLAFHQFWLTNFLSGPSIQSDDSRIDHVIDLPNVKGYSGKMSEALIEEIRKRPEVKYVEPDQVMYAMDLVNGKSRKELIRNAVYSISHSKPSPKLRPEMRITDIHKQDGAPWGICRVSHGNRPLDMTKYMYPRTSGEGVDVYIVDTGINIAHHDFEGRAKWGATIPEGDIDIDGNGHGTHCAGTIGSRSYGLAKKATLIAVKVLRTSGFGTNADVIKGVQWVIESAKRSRKKSVANMSLGGGRSLTLEYVVNEAVRSGVHFAVAAGNDNENACDYSPAAAKGPITVGASNIRDQMTFFSNHGPCVDIFAPGMDILSTWIGSRDATNIISGTSMASPHVAGVLALYLGEEDYDPESLKEILVKHANKGLLSDLPRHTENRLLSTRRLLDALVVSD